jgi:phage-related holin
MTTAANMAHKLKVSNEHLDFFSATINEFKMLIYAIFVYLNLRADLMTILFWMMAIDTFVGPIKALRIDPNEFSFKKIMIGFFSKLAFLCLPATVALLMKGLDLEWKTFLDFSIKLLIVSEGISVLSNLVSIKTRQEVKDYDLISRFILFIRLKLIMIGESILGGFKDK